MEYLCDKCKHHVNGRCCNSGFCPGLMKKIKPKIINKED